MAEQINIGKKYIEWTKEALIKEIKQLKKRKKFGLVWEDEPEEVAEFSKTHLPILEEERNLKIIKETDGQFNIFIEGDNFHALSVLNYTHAGKVDIVYIDPPYNTGNKDFIYNDSYIDREDSYRHSKWLSFMAKRLRLAKSVLKDTGLIFVSIDDNELAQLKLLMDELFGADNFRNTLVVSRVKKNIQEREFAKSLNLGHGYILVYGKSKASIKTPTKPQKKEERWHAFDAPGIRSTMEYELFGHKPPKNRHWMFAQPKAQDLIDRGLLRPSPRTGKPQYKLDASSETMLDTNWTDLQEGSSRWGFNNGEKNVELIKRIIEMHSSKDCVVLDFFAGSGTTGQAVLELNKKDRGNRQFILCTDNEENNGSGLRIASDICYPRLKSVIEGHEYRGKPVKGLGSNLKYFKTSFSEQVVTDGDKRKFVNHITDMLCLAENTFDEVIFKKGQFSIYTSSRQVTGIVYDEDSIADIKIELKKLNKPIVIYVFSYDNTYDEEDFSDVRGLTKVKPIPTAILNIYARIVREGRKKINL